MTACVRYVFYLQMLTIYLFIQIGNHIILPQMFEHDIDLLTMIVLIWNAREILISSIDSLIDDDAPVEPHFHYDPTSI